MYLTIFKLIMASNQTVRQHHILFHSGLGLSGNRSATASVLTSRCALICRPFGRDSLRRKGGKEI